MAVANLNFPRFRAFDANGSPLNGGTVTVYEAGTTTKTTIWNDKDKTATLSNPVTLDANGEAEIWFEGPVKVVLADSAGNQQWTIDDVPSDIPPSDVGRFNLLENGSFEIDSNGDNLPDDWTISEDDSTSTVELDTTNVSHGANSLKFVSQGSGGGTATSTDFFEVNAGKTCVVAFTIKSSVADVRNQVQVRYFDKDQSFISADTVYDEDTSNPTTFEEKRFVSSVPASATYAKLRLIGCDPSDNTSGTTYFDDVKVFTDQQAAVYSDGTSVVNADNIKNAITASTSGISFPNVNANVTATDEELNKLDGFTGSTSDLNSYPSLDTPFDATNGGNDDLTEINFTGIKSGAKRITVILEQLSLTGTNDIEVRIGDSQGIESSGYESSGARISSSSQTVSQVVDSFFIKGSGGATVLSGSIVLVLLNSSTNTWVVSYVLGASSAVNFGGGEKSLSAELDRIQIATGGADTFDNGNVNILVE